MPSRSGATPIIWGDHIFLNVATAMTTGELELWAVDRKGGQPLWKRPLGGGNNQQRKQNMSTPSPVTDGTHRVGDDRHRHPEGVRFQGHRAVDARRAEGLRPLRLELGLRVVAAAAPGRALHPGPARDEDRRSVVRDEGRRQVGEDDLEGRAADAGDLGVAGRVHDAGARERRQDVRDCDHRRRHRHRTRSRRRGRSCGAPTASTRPTIRTTASWRRGFSSNGLIIAPTRNRPMLAMQAGRRRRRHAEPQGVELRSRSRRAVSDQRRQARLRRSGTTASSTRST